MINKNPILDEVLFLILKPTEATFASSLVLTLAFLKICSRNLNNYKFPKRNAGPMSQDQNENHKQMFTCATSQKKKSKVNQGKRKKIAYIHKPRSSHRTVFRCLKVLQAHSHLHFFTLTELLNYLVPYLCFCIWQTFRSIKNTNRLA